MTKVLTTTISLGLALALCGPAHAQLIHGGLGGGLGGGFGGGIGRGLPIDGNIGINGTLNSADAPVRSIPRAPKPAKTVTNPKLVTTTTLNATATGAIRTPSLSAAPITAAVTRINGRVVVRDAQRLVVVPAIPDYAVRRTAIIESGIVPIGYAEAPAYIDTQYQVLQNDLRGSGVEVVRRGQQIVLEMPSDVTFAFDKYDIQPRFRPVLDTVAHTLSKYSATYIDVDGHTDAIGSMGYNQTLSERRADSVANYLSERAVTPVRMHVEGFGKTEPIASNATITGRAANRRVEIVLTPYVG